MTMRGLLALHGLDRHGHKIMTPYGEPKTLWERLVFPMLKVAWLDGYHACATEPAVPLSVDSEATE